MSDRDTLADTLAAGMDTWPNRPWLVLPGPVDIGSELAEHLTKHLAGWRPPAREITTIEERDALPVGSIVVDFFEAGCTRISAEPPYGWVRVSSALPMGRQYGVPHLPATVLYVPTEEAPRG